MGAWALIFNKADQMYIGRSLNDCHDSVVLPPPSTTVLILRIFSVCLFVCICFLFQDFGDYVESYYSVQTNEGEKISQLIAGYIDIILKKVNK